MVKARAPQAAVSTNIRRRIAMNSEPAAVTTQEAIEWSREKVMRIASVEQIELGNFMELSTTGSGTRVGKAIIPVWRIVTTQIRWMEFEESQPLDSRQALVGLCSSALEGVVENRQGSD